MIIVNTYSEYMAYFRDLADANPDINGFVSGDSLRILSQDRSSLEYPVLWVESPQVNWVFQNGLLKQVFQGAFVVLQNAELEHWQQEDFVMDKCCKITSDLIRKVKLDAEAGLFYLELNQFGSNPIQTYGHDNDHGWRTEISIFTNDGYCVDECKDQSFCPVGTLARFEYNNAVEGDFSSLTITNKTLPESYGFTFEWTWQIDEQAEQTSTDTNPIISGTGKYCLINLKITSGACIRYASIFISNKKNCGQSVPYKLESKYC